MKHVKYLISFLLSFAMLLSLVPVTALADGAQTVVIPDGSGVTNPAVSIELTDPSADSWFYLYSFAGEGELVWPDETYNYYENTHTVTVRLIGQDPSLPCDDKLAAFSGNECDVVTLSCDETGGDLRQITVAQGGFGGGAGYTLVTSSGATASFYAYNLPIPSSVKLSRTSASLPVNRILNLTSPQVGIWATDNPDVATVSQTGTVKGIANGIAHITLTYTEYGLNLVGTCTVKVGTGISSDAERVAAASYRIFAERAEALGTPPNGAEGTDGGTIRLEMQFPDDLVLTDAQAAADSFIVSSASSVQGTNDHFVTAQGNTLTLEMSVSFMPGGILEFDNTEIAGVSCAGLPVCLPEDFHTVVPTGLTFHPVKMEIGTATTPASTTIRIDRSANVRSMNHILWTSNGASILKGNGTAQTTAAHHHNYWSFTLGTSANFIQQGGSSLPGYTVTAENDTVTITADSPQPGEFLGIYNYDDDFLQTYGFSLSDHVEGLSAPLVYEKLDIAQRCTVSAPHSSDWTGNPICPDVMITDGYHNGEYQYQLRENEDYTLTYNNNVEKGSRAEIIITGMGDYLGSSLVKYFTVTSPMEAAMFSVDTSAEEFKAAAWSKEISSPAGLKEGTDYRVNYFNNAFPGTARIEISGIGNYSGTLTYEFTINPKSISKEMFVVDTSDATYTGTAIEPEIKTSLRKNAEYKVSYSNNQNPGTAEITITGAGNYTGSLTWPFSILCIDDPQLDASYHTIITDPSVAATVFKSGKTAGSHCIVCGKVFKKQAAIKKLKPTITLSAAKKTLKVKKSFTLKVSKLAKGDAIKNVKTSRSTVASVKKAASGKYKITAKKAGKATITVTLKSGKKATCKVIVKK